MKRKITISLREQTGKFKFKGKKVILLLNLIVMNFLFMLNKCYAAPTDPDATFNSTIDFIAGWINKFGFGIAFIGAVMFALGFRNDDAEGKTKGLRTLIAGFIVAAVGMKFVYNGIFGLGTP